MNLSEPGTVSLSANEPAAGETITAALGDPDGGIDNLSWAWARVNDEGATPIQGAGEASYTTTSADIGHRISATASYDDNAGTDQSAEAVTALPVRNDPPRFENPAESRQVPEDAQGGTPVGAPVTATDPNGDPVAYSLSESTAFTVDQSSGQINVAEAAVLDHETGPVHTLTVTATDTHGASDQVPVTVNVVNVDEPGAMYLDHGPLRKGTIITAVLADPDGNISEEAWTWSRSDNPIAGAATHSYTVAAEDVGHVLTARVSYQDGHGPRQVRQRRHRLGGGERRPRVPRRGRGKVHRRERGSRGIRGRPGHRGGPQRGHDELLPHGKRRLLNQR